MQKKYELTNETRVYKGKTLHRIRALRDFTGVFKGRLGGWVENEANLSHDGNCWLFDNSAAYGHATVMHDATLWDEAEACDYARVKHNALADGFTEILGRAVLGGTCRIRDHVTVQGTAFLSGLVQVTGNTTIGGNVVLGGSTSLCLNFEIKQTPIFFAGDGPDRDVLFDDSLCFNGVTKPLLEWRYWATARKVMWTMTDADYIYLQSLLNVSAKIRGIGCQIDHEEAESYRRAWLGENRPG